MDRSSSNRFSGGTWPAGPSGRRALRRLVVIGAISVVLAAGIAPTSAAAARGPRIGPVRIFASVPAPGHPFGIAVDDGRVYVSTSAGDFFADPANGGHRNSDGERVFTYSAGGTLLAPAQVPPKILVANGDDPRARRQPGLPARRIFTERVSVGGSGGCSLKTTKTSSCRDRLRRRISARPGCHRQLRTLVPTTPPSLTPSPGRD